MSVTVRSETTGRVTTVILDRPAARNAVDRATAADLTAAFLAFDRDPGADVAVLWGAHGVFCSGADLRQVAAAGTSEWLEDLAAANATAVEPLGSPMGPPRLNLSKPVIAAIAGPAVAGGMELALWCDLRVVEESGYFGVYCRRWGVPLIDGGTVRLPRLVGLGRALDIILTGRQVAAREALAIGLCDRIVPDGKARSAAEELAADLARFPQECLRADRAAVLRQEGLTATEALRQELDQGIAALRREGVAGATRFVRGQGRHGSFTDL